MESPNTLLQFFISPIVIPRDSPRGVDTTTDDVPIFVEFVVISDKIIVSLPSACNSLVAQQSIVFGRNVASVIDSGCSERIRSVMPLASVMPLITEPSSNLS